MAVKSKEFGERFKRKVEEKYPSKTAFAAKLGMPPQSLQNFFRGQVPDHVRLKLFADALGVTPHWLLQGEDIEVEIPDRDLLYDLVPEVDGFISGGPGSLPSNEIKDWIWIPKKHLPGAGGALRYAAVKVKGDSMEPLILHGETVVIDRTDTDIENIKQGSLYAVWKDGHHHVKFVHYNPKEQVLQLVSYSQDYTRQHGVETIKLEKGMDNPVEGKVVFSFRRWK